MSVITAEEPIIRGEWLSERGLSLPPRLPFERWLEVGEQLKRLEKGVQFWIGDWVNYGEREYGDKYAQAVLETGKSKGTLANYGYVARRVETSRRREDVDFGHYQNIAALEPEQQEDALDRIESEHLTVSQSRELVRTKGKSVQPITLLDRVKQLEAVAQEAYKAPGTPDALRAQIEAYRERCGWLD